MRTDIYKLLGRHIDISKIISVSEPELKKDLYDIEVIFDIKFELNDKLLYFKQELPSFRLFLNSERFEESFKSIRDYFDTPALTGLVVESARLQRYEMMEDEHLFYMFHGFAANKELGLSSPIDICRHIAGLKNFFAAHSELLEVWKNYKDSIVAMEGKS